MHPSTAEQLRPIFGLGPRTRLAIVLGGLIALDVWGLASPKPDYDVTFRRCRDRVTRAIAHVRPKGKASYCQAFVEHAQTTMTECMEETQGAPQICFATHNVMGELQDADDAARVCTEDADFSQIGLFCVEPNGTIAGQ